MFLSVKRPQLWGALGILFHSVHVATAIQLTLGNTDSIKSAARTLADGMMSFYNGNQTGMPIGLLPGPYYWWEAGAMFGQMVEYWYYTGDDTYNDVVTQGLLAQVGPHNDFMPPNQTKTEGNDDQAFWAFAAMSAAEFKFPDPPPKQPSWLSLAQAVFNEQADRWETAHCGGGLRWQIYLTNNGYNYKNSISNGGFFQLAARLARYTNNATYADWAEKTWDWMTNSVLMDDNYYVYDGTQMATNCTVPTKIQWTYNAGTMLMGAANMYNYTNGNSTWHTRLLKTLNATQIFFPASFGGNIMQEVACEPQHTCNYDQPSFKAYLARWMAATTQLAPFTSNYIMPKLKASANGAAGQCSGAPRGNTMCGRTWNSSTWDGNQGVGEEMSALAVVQANLVQKVAGPVSLAKGGTSVSNPGAGQPSGGPQAGPLPALDTREVTAGDKAGASILTAGVISGLVGTLAWISL